MASNSANGSTAVAGVMLGIGMGGFVDGILFHQIFQVHAMLSARLPLDGMENMRTNMLADGIFHAVVWVTTMAGIVLLWRALTRPQENHLSARAFVGCLLAGWGSFNLVEGIIDHHVLGLHHVVERLGASIWDWVFLASGIALASIGLWMARHDKVRGDASP